MCTLTKAGWEFSVNIFFLIENAVSTKSEFSAGNFQFCQHCLIFPSGKSKQNISFGWGRTESKCWVLGQFDINLCPPPSCHNASCDLSFRFFTPPLSSMGQTPWLDYISHYAHLRLNHMVHHGSHTSTGHHESHNSSGEPMQGNTDYCRTDIKWNISIWKWWNFLTFPNKNLLELSVPWKKKKNVGTSSLHPSLGLKQILKYWKIRGMEILIFT